MSTLDVLKKLDKETKAEVYIVGGYVRDLLRNKSNVDLDIVVRGLSVRNIKKFLIRYGKVKEVILSKMSTTIPGISTSILLFKASDDALEAQISLPRRGKRQIPGSHNTLRQDVKFRDFRINCLYLSVNYKSKKDVIDIVGGVKDIRNKRIVPNGSVVERFRESPVRILRAISLAARTNYSLDDKVIKAIKKNAGLVHRIPAECIRAEFNKILMSKRPSRYLKLLGRLGILKEIFPEINQCIGVKQDKRYHKYDVFNHIIYTCDNCEFDLVLRLAGLLHDIGKPIVYRKVKLKGKEPKITFHKHEMASVKITKALLKRLKYDNATIKEVSALVKLHMYHYTRNWTDTAVRKFIKRADIGEEYMEVDKIGNFPLFKLRASERMGNGLKSLAVTERQLDFEKRIVKIFKKDHAFEIKDLDINGNIIIEAFNIRPGEFIGKILKYLLEAVLKEHSVNNRSDLLKLTGEYIYNSKDGQIIN